MYVLSLSSLWGTPTTPHPNGVSLSRDRTTWSRDGEWRSAVTLTKRTCWALSAVGVRILFPEAFSMFCFKKSSDLPGPRWMLLHWDCCVVSEFCLFVPSTSCDEISALENKERLEEMKRILHDELPDDNYFILKYVVNFLQEVSSWLPILPSNTTCHVFMAGNSFNDSASLYSRKCGWQIMVLFLQVESRCEQNKMTAQNLAIVFGPNLMWSKSQVRIERHFFGLFLLRRSNSRESRGQNIFRRATKSETYLSTLSSLSLLLPLSWTGQDHYPSPTIASWPRRW